MEQNLSFHIFTIYLSSLTFSHKPICHQSYYTQQHLFPLWLILLIGNLLLQQFGSHEAVKPEVIHHWENANQNDDEHRFNIEGMKEQDFLFPTSKNGLKAAKAAGMIADQDTYWAVFDGLQQALFVENRDISDLTVIEDVVKKTSIDFDDWKVQFENPETEQAVLEDLQRVQDYGIQGAPALVVNQKYLISGAQPQEVIEQTIEKIAKEEGFQLKGLTLMGSNAAACNMIDGKWVCD